MVAIEHRGSLMTHKNEEGQDCCLGYLLVFPQMGVFEPNLGKVDVTGDEAEEHNRLLSQAEIDGLDNQCEVGQGSFFYIHKDAPSVRTWNGDPVAESVARKGNKFVFVRNGRRFEGKRDPGEDVVFFVRVS